MYAWMQHQCPDVRIPHLYGFGFSDHRHVSHLYGLMASVLTMLLAYSLYMSNKGPSTSAFGACSSAVSATFFDALPSHTIPHIQRANGLLPHICFLNISVLIRARCSPIRGRGIATTQYGGRISSEACLA
jgi:hypothetical protein